MTDPEDAAPRSSNSVEIEDALPVGGPGRGCWLGSARSDALEQSGDSQCGPCVSVCERPDAVKKQANHEFSGIFTLFKESRTRSTQDALLDYE